MGRRFFNVKRRKRNATIDMTATGKNITRMMKAAGMTVKDLTGNLRIRNTAGHLQMEEWDGHADDR